METRVLKRALDPYLKCGDDKASFFDGCRFQDFPTLMEIAKEEKKRLLNVILNLENFQANLSRYIKTKQYDREELTMYGEKPKVLSLGQYVHVELKKSGLKNRIIDDTIMSSLEQSHERNFYRTKTDFRVTDFIFLNAIERHWGYGKTKDCLSPWQESPL